MGNAAVARLSPTNAFTRRSAVSRPWLCDRVPAPQPCRARAAPRPPAGDARVIPILVTCGVSTLGFPKSEYDTTIYPFEM